MGVPPPEPQEKLDLQWDSMRIVGRNCRLTRKQLGITQLELSMCADIQAYQISRIENDKYYNVSYFTLCLVARALGISVSQLCDFDLFYHK